MCDLELLSSNDAVARVSRSDPSGCPSEITDIELLAAWRSGGVVLRFALLFRRDMGTEKHNEDQTTMG